MKNSIATFLTSLLSRKFLLALAAIIAAIATHRYGDIQTIVVGYFGANVVESVGTAKATASQVVAQPENKVDAPAPEVTPPADAPPAGA